MTQELTDLAARCERAEDWYPALKTRPDPACEFPVNLDFHESAQVQEFWAIDGSVGPEVMVWIDGLYFDWWPKISMERAVDFAALKARGME